MPPRYVASHAVSLTRSSARGSTGRLLRGARRTHALAALLAASLAVLGACGDGTGPGARQVRLEAAGGDRQFAQAGETLDQPLQVIVIDPATQRPVEDVDVSWRVVAGDGTLSAARTQTDDIGVASVELRLGAAAEVRVEANADGNTGQPVPFVARIVAPPAIQSVTPTTIAPGETVTITGEGFLPTPADNAVVFGGIRGTVVSARPDQLVVTAPTCLQNRVVELRVHLGQVPSAPVQVQTTAATNTALDLEPGQVARLAGDDIDCVRLENVGAGATFLVIPQDASRTVGLPVDFQLIARVGAAPPVTVPNDAASPAYTSDWELALRARERTFLQGIERPRDILLPQASPLKQEPRIGDRREFNVLNSDQKSVRVTAEVQAISTRAIMYVDLEAPGNGFTPQDLTAFGALFDDPIYAKDVALFGSPTDVDGNGRIIILFTPKVNALTRRGEEGFVAGYFYGCDLVDAARCRDTNRAEIFYSMVPDPEGRFGDARSRNVVLRTVPGILAHEFQHMIHFGEKGSLDVLWLSEGLAHTAEDIVGRIFEERGQPTLAAQFRNPNFGRGNRYLAAVGDVSIIGESSPGTLELRGGAWLFIEHLVGRYGEEILGKLTRTSLNAVENIETQTGESWDQLISDFAVALWADQNSDVDGIGLDDRFTFPRLQLRTQLGMFQGGFPLQPPTATFVDFQLSGRLASAAHEYVLLRATGTEPPPPINMTFAGLLGGPFTANARPQLTILRVR